jgi:hypothetical protein
MLQDLLYEGGGFLADKREDAVDGAAGDADAAALFAPGALDTGDSKLTPALWFNLDGPSALCALKVGGFGALQLERRAEDTGLLYVRCGALSLPGLALPWLAMP